jgi:YidC/Oxa1 family membrane protein insertase
VFLPLYNLQIKSSQKMQAIQPKLNELQAKYPGKDMDSRTKMLEEQQALFKEYGVSPYAAMWPLLIQMPVLIALFQALTRVEALREGHFLWMDIAKPDPYFLLPILAAAFTFASSWLTAKGTPTTNSSLKIMTYVMPAMILVIGLGMASGVALYWTVSNAFQVGQILVFNNPFKMIAEREAEARAIKAREAKIRKAKKKAKKQR